MKRLCLFLFTLLLLAGSVLSQSRFAEFPFGKSSSTSPDGAYTLVADHCKPDSDACNSKLWLVNKHTGARRLLTDIARTIRIGWAPSGSAFFLNDDWGSNGADAYLYPSPENKRVDIGELLLQKFPQDRHFADDSHHYINGIRWIDADTVVVRRSGHFDKYVSGGNEFSICYSVGTTGNVKRLRETHKENDSCTNP